MSLLIVCYVVDVSSCPTWMSLSLTSFGELLERIGPDTWATTSTRAPLPLRPLSPHSLCPFCLPLGSTPPPFSFAILPLLPLPFHASLSSAPPLSLLPPPLFPLPSSLFSTRSYAQACADAPPTPFLATIPHPFCALARARTRTHPTGISARSRRWKIGPCRSGHPEVVVQAGVALGVCP